jgi:hypothetical protein
MRSNVTTPSALIWLLFLLSSGCGGSYDETIAGVAVPVPKSMTRSSEKPVEMSLLGFGAGQATFHGDMKLEDIVEFYKTEMPGRGWQPNMNLRGGVAMLSYIKEGRTLLIAVGKQDNETNLTLTISGAGR